MQHDTARYAPVKTYVSTFDEVAPIPPPAIVEVQAQPATVEHNLGFVLTIANLAVTAILITGMLVNGSQVQSAILVGGFYFATTTTAFVFVITGALTAMVNGWQRETTERLRVQAYRELGELALDWRLAVEETRQMELQGRRPPTEGVQRISPLNGYVAPFADGEQAQVEGVRFAMGLYNTLGRPDPKRVQEDGRLKIKMLGSKRGAGSREAGKWLLREGIIQRVQGGYALNVDSYPTRDTLRHLL